MGFAAEMQAYACDARITRVNTWQVTDGVFLLMAADGKGYIGWMRYEDA